MVISGVACGILMVSIRNDLIARTDLMGSCFEVAIRPYLLKMMNIYCNCFGISTVIPLKPKWPNRLMPIRGAAIVRICHHGRVGSGYLGINCWRCFHLPPKRPLPDIFTLLIRTTLQKCSIFIL